MTDYIRMQMSNISDTRKMLVSLESRARQYTVAIFPKGTRTHDGKLNSFYRQTSIRIDVGEVNEMHFLIGISLGFDAQVASLNYERRATITSKGECNETDCFINTISIGRRFAGSFFLTPNAIANDGLLDVCMIRKLNLLQRLKILTMVPKGTHIKDRKVDYYQTEKLELDFGKKVPYHVEGNH